MENEKKEQAIENFFKAWKLLDDYFIKIEDSCGGFIITPDDVSIVEGEEKNV